MFGEENQDARRSIIEDGYIDDTISGAEDVKAAKALEKGIREIAAKGSFYFKPSVISGDDIERQTVLGVEWKPLKDNLSVCCKMNVSAKRKGVRTEQNLDLEKLTENLPENLTMRQIFSIIMAQFDPLGFISPIVIQLKLIMRSLAGGQVDKKKWSALVPKEVSDKFKMVVLKLKDARKLEFPRCVIPEKAIGNPTLCTFFDGSSVAYCA